jgi:pimeloyl-ACP methyl ester carboxylesterase
LRKVQPGAGMGGFLLAVLFILPQQLFWGRDFGRGEILDPVFCQHDFTQSYTLYLPTTYQAGRRWPVIYCFDPGGKGSIPVALFKEGAEKYGYILVGSNNSKNGPWEVILQAVRAIWRDTHARLAIDDQRIYAAGFSGGARVAFGLGQILSIKLSGVIACGAGLPEWLEPENVIDVPCFGTVGLQDFNYREMQELERQLRLQGTPCLLRVFQGRHSWPPPKLALEAVAWLQVQDSGLETAPEK